MKKYLYAVLCLLIMSLSQKGLSQQVLNRSLYKVGLSRLVSEIDDWRQLKKQEWKSSIASVPSQERQYIIARAEKFLDYDWPSLLAMKYLEYKEKGIRVNYEADVIERRQVLTNLVLAELLEGKGRFLPQIVNGLWLTLEESTWVSPAHIVSQKGGIGLPNPLDSYIDLGTGRIAADLASISFLLGEEINKLSPQLNNRIRVELERRILNPYSERTDFWWMNFESSFVNNWNIWINTNVIKTALLIDTDTVRLTKLLDKITRSADKFIDYYPEDGLCEEGPSYWSHAGGELGLMLRLLQDFSAGQIMFADQNKLHNIGTYIRNAHIAGKRFINFEDAESIQLPSSTKIWAYANLFNDDELRSFAAEIDALRGHQIPLSSVQEFVAYTGIMHEVRKFPIRDSEALEAYYPSLQLAIIREKIDQHNLFFTAIGGHNGVSHNHNDVGSFMLYVDTLPVFIDVGVGTYTSETFGPRRYTLWNMQSQWHNVPIVNNTQQRDGQKYKAKDVKFTKKGDNYSYEVDVAESYPTEAAVSNWSRTFRFSPKKKLLSIKEQFSLRAYSGESSAVLITPYQPVRDRNTVTLELADGIKTVVEFDPKLVSVAFEEKNIEDPKIVKNWGDRLYRIKLKANTTNLKGTIDYRIKLEY